MVYVCPDPYARHRGFVGETPCALGRDPLGRALINHDIRDIDPTAFVDDDGQAYLYWGNNGLWYVKLTRSMVDYNGEITEIPLTEETVGGYEEKYKDENGEEQTRLVGVDKYEEGPWVYKRREKYYLVYAAGGIPEHLSYSMSDSPTGPMEISRTYYGLARREFYDPPIRGGFQGT